MRMQIFGIIVTVVVLLFGQISAQTSNDGVESYCSYYFPKTTDRATFLYAISRTTPCQSGNQCDEMSVDGECYVLCKYESDPVVFSQVNNGTEYIQLKTRVEETVKTEKEVHKSIWFCLKGRLVTLKTIILNIHLCQHSLKPYVDTLHKKFANNAESATEILLWFRSEIAQYDGPVESWFRGWILYILNLTVTEMKAMTEDEALALYGPECYKSLSKACTECTPKPCRCL